MGVVLEGVRFVLGGPTVRTSRDVADTPLQSGWRVPARMGGGFLFRREDALYGAETFEGLLRPVVALPADVADVSFGPTAALVRAESGERWMIDLASGKRVSIAPPGLLDVAALDDGRAAALVEGGALLVSTDAGAHWTDAPPRLARRRSASSSSRAHPTHEELLWIETQASHAASGCCPEAASPSTTRCPPPRRRPRCGPSSPTWREDEPPLRRAMRSGAPSRDGAALVVASGDLVQVDVVTGAVDVVAAGKLPPDATCVGDADARTTSSSRAAAAAARRSSSRTRSTARPSVEQTFPDGGRFVVSDDGGILWVGSATSRSRAQHHVACVRVPGGGWQQVRSRRRRRGRGAGRRSTSSAGSRARTAARSPSCRGHRRGRERVGPRRRRAPARCTRGRPTR